MASKKFEAPKLSESELEQERWKPIRDFEDTYEISNFGRIRRILIGGHVNNSGYLIFALYRNRKPHFRTIHSMVAEAFIGPRPAKFDVHHKDADKTNNRDSNLEYMTRSENSKIAWKMGAWKNRKLGRRSWRLTESQVREIRTGTDPGYKLARRFAVHPATISEVRTGKSYRWVKPISSSEPPQSQSTATT